MELNETMALFRMNLNNKTMDTSNYITPTTQQPIFMAISSYFGPIAGPYKEWCISSINSVGPTFALNYKDAIHNLHEWMIENKDMIIRNCPATSTFFIQVVNGNTKSDEKVAHKVYEINVLKAKQYLF